MLQQEKPEDYVIATGRQFSVREFVQRCADLLDLELTWQGSGVDEKAIEKRKSNRCSGSSLLSPHRSRNPVGDSGKAQPRTWLDTA